MKQTPTLNERLLQCAAFVRPGKPMCDVGTDHGYLPIYLLQNKRVPCCIGADVRPGPLAVARANAEKYGVTDRLSLRLCDGLAAIQPHECDSIVIAGMGGELIARIILAAPWLQSCSQEHRLILQPMSSAYELRKALRENGFMLEEEITCKSLGRVYSVMQVSYRGKDLTRGEDELSLYMGAIDPCQPHAREYALHLCRNLHNEEAGWLCRQKSASGAYAAFCGDNCLRLHVVLGRMEEVYLRGAAEEAAGETEERI